MWGHYFKSITPKVYICLAPIAVFISYLVAYAAFQAGLNISQTAITESVIAVQGNKFNVIDEAVYRSAWGISLIILSVVNLCLLAYCLYCFVVFKHFWLNHKGVSILAFVFALILWFVIALASLGGGTAGEIYQYINTYNLGVHFTQVIDITTANGYVAVFCVSIVLAFLCYESHQSDAEKLKKYFQVYKNLFYLVSVFLSLSILQVFVQYQWFSVFLSKDPGLKLITFGYPFIISVFYVGLFCVLFLPVAGIIRQVAVSTPQINNNQVNPLVSGYVGINSILGVLKSFIVFIAPIITVILAEILKVLFAE